MLHKEIFLNILLFAVTLRHFTFCTNSSAYIIFGNVCNYLSNCITWYPWRCPIGRNMLDCGNT